MRIANAEKANQALQLWNRATTSERSQWLSKMQECRDFYLDEQLTNDEYNALKDAGMPTFTINRITSIIQTMMYFVTANQPRWKAIGTESSDAAVAEIHQHVADWCWNLSNGNSVYSQVVLDSTVKGIGYFFVDVDKNLDNGKGEVKLSRLDPFDVFVEQKSTDFLFRDAAYMQVRKNIAKETMKLLMPKYKAKIENASGSEDISTTTQRSLPRSRHFQPEDITTTYKATTGEVDEILPYLETYIKIQNGYYNLYMKQVLTEEQLQQIQKNVDVGVQEVTKELGVELKELEVKLMQQVQQEEMLPERMELEMEKAGKAMEESIVQQEELLRTQAQEEISKVENLVIPEAEYKELLLTPAIADRIIDAVLFYEPQIKVIQTYGDAFLNEYMRPEKDYPIIPIPYMYTGTTYPLSAVSPMMGKQEEINKAHQIMIHNANLASNMRWLYVEGSIDDEIWGEDGARPGARLPYRQGFDAPTPIFPSQLNNAFYQITQEGKSDIEYIAGIQSSMMGVTGSGIQHETYRGMLANDEYGTRRIKAWMKQIVEPALEHLGRVFQQTAQAHYTIDKVFRITQPNPYLDQGEEKRMNIPIYNNKGDEIKKYLDYESANFDVRIVAGATLPVNRWMLLDEYWKWFEGGLIDDVAMIGQTDLPDKEAIMQRKSRLAQAEQMVEQLQEQTKDQEKMIGGMRNQLVQQGIKGEIEQAKVQIDKKLTKTDGEQKVTQGLIKNELDKAKLIIQQATANAVERIEGTKEKEKSENKA